MVVAFTSAGRGVENDRDPFFSVQLSPAVPVDADSVETTQLNDTSINMTWTGLSLIEAREFQNIMPVLYYHLLITVRRGNPPPIFCLC